MIKIKNVSKWCGSFQVLTNCITSVKKSEVVMVCGPSGSGRPTLIRTVSMLGPLQRGEVFVDSILVGARGTNLPKLRSCMGMVFQNFGLFLHLSITRNLTAAQQKAPGRSKEEAMAKDLKYLDHVGLKAHAAKYPDQLSNSQQRRVAIARALSIDSVCMPSDEPTSTLDPEMVNEVLDVMMELAREGMTMTHVTHEVDFACKVANHVAFTDQGHAVEDCEREEFFGNTDIRFGRAEQFLSKIPSH